MITLTATHQAVGSPEGVMPEGQYIYCIIGTGEARNFGPVGIGDRGDPVTTITYRDLAAVVSSTPMAKYIVSKETMVSHEKVIEVVMSDYTLLPVRFYTVAPNAEEIRSLLRRRYPEFKKLLRELDNKVELGLKAVWRDMNAILHEILNESGEIRASAAKMTSCPAEEVNQDKGAVGEMLKMALERKKSRESEAFLHPLRRLCSDFCLNTTYGDDMLMNAAFLVERAREKEFDGEVEKLVTQYGDKIGFKYVGPAPPYSFVNIVVEE